MARVQVEAVAWLTNLFGAGESGRRITEEEVPDGATVADVFEMLAAKYDRFDQAVFDLKTRTLASHVNVVVNDVLIEVLEGLNTKIHHGDRILLLPAYSGGA